MPAGKRAAPGLTPIALPDTDALPWVRLVTGLVALAILALPAGRHAADWTVRPIADRVISVATLPPLEPAMLQSREPVDPVLESALRAGRPARSTAGAPSVFTSVSPPRQLRAKASPFRASRVASTKRATAASTRIARARHGLTRAQVVRAYLASREQVAALTGEDSGSAYLGRLAARQRSSRYALALP